MSAMLVSLLFSATSMDVKAKTKTMQLRIIETSDVHGSFFPYDFITRKPKQGTLARVSSYIKAQRKMYGDKVILLENGDILQGQPTCYYYNYINTQVPNVASKIMNYMNYDAATIGNHDIETGHAVYDKWASEVNCPMLGANIIETATGKPYFLPYTTINREGAKIAIVGLISPAIPNWLTENLWSGMRFDEMISSARQTISTLKEEEHPDIIIGLFHSGKEGGITTDTYTENASLEVAVKVAGFDAVFFGHDHTTFAETITNDEGREVLCLDPANNARYVAQAVINMEKHKGKWTVTEKHGELVDVTTQPIDEDFIAHFSSDIEEVNRFVGRKIGEFGNTITSQECFFGSSAFTDLILNLQLQITGADISFNAPLSSNATIAEGPVYVSDMFNLYKYENQLYVMRLKGSEIRKHLEMSYDQWVNTMRSADDHLLLIERKKRNNVEKWDFRNMTFNFDSAAGIDYEVDVTKPDGEKVRILRMSDGRPFSEDEYYKVAVNSYRGNGGGELLTRGAGIPHDSLESRIIYRSEKDQRYYLMKEIEKLGTITPKANNNWRFVPDSLVAPAARRDYDLLFGKKDK